MKVSLMSLAEGLGLLALLVGSSLLGLRFGVPFEALILAAGVALLYEARS